MHAVATGSPILPGQAHEHQSTLSPDLSTSPTSTKFTRHNEHLMARNGCDNRLDEEETAAAAAAAMYVSAA